MEGLQIQRFTDPPGDAVEEANDGEYVLFSDAEKFHTQLQEALGKNMALTVDIETRNQQLTEVRAESRTLRNESERLLVERDKMTAERDGLREAIANRGCGYIRDELEGDGDCLHNYEWLCDDCPVVILEQEARAAQKGK